MTKQSTKDFFKKYFSKEEIKDSMQLSLSQFQADLIRNALKLYDIKILSSSQEWREYDNLFDKLAELSDTSRADDFFKRAKIKHGKDLDIL